MPRQTVLIVEDERDLVEVLQYNLEREGYAVLVARDGQDALTKARGSLPDLILLDLMLPVMDGLAVCRELRADPRTKPIRVLMLTARAEEVDEVVGFHMGADDYVTKPFKMKPLLSRVKALLRRPVGDEPAGEVVSAHGLTVDRAHHAATMDGEDLGLTPTEFRLLWTLMRQPGRPFSRHELLDASRGEDANALERTIDVHVRSLRQKLGANADLLETVRGIGYRFRTDRGDG